MTTFGESYKEMGLRSMEGRFLDIRVLSERFELYFSQIDFLDNNTKNRLVSLLQNTDTNIGTMNPYAFAIGYASVIVDPISGSLSITKDSLEESYKLLSRTNYADIVLSTLIEKSDILRYARLYIRVQAFAIKEGKNPQILEPVDEDEDRDIEEGYEDENDYGDENEYGGEDYDRYENDSD